MNKLAKDATEAVKNVKETSDYVKIGDSYYDKIIKDGKKTTQKRRNE